MIGYNFAIESWFDNDPTTLMSADISFNHSAHGQFNLMEGNYVGKIGCDGYHGSASHNTIFRNVATGRTSFGNQAKETCVSLDRRNTHYNIVGNVFGDPNDVHETDYATASGFSGGAIYRLGYPDIGNNTYTGTYPPTALTHGGGGSRDLYVDRDDTANGTTMIEGNWDSVSDSQDWTITPEPIPDSLYHAEKPEFFGDVEWPPFAANIATRSPLRVPAGKRFLAPKGLRVEE